MQPAGETAFAARREDRTAIYSFERHLALDETAEAALHRDAGGWAYWEALPKGYRRSATYWVMSAKREETRERRLTKLVDACVIGERLPCARNAPAARSRGPDRGRAVPFDPPRASPPGSGSSVARWSRPASAIPRRGSPHA